MGFRIGAREVGAGQPLFIVAELGLNHGGSVERALALVDAAAAAGASAVKLQTLVADRLVTADAPAPAHLAVRSMRDFFRQFELDESEHRLVADRARQRGLAFISTPFDPQSVDMLERVGCDALKIASGDLTHHQLVARAAGAGRPLLISTGLSELHEVAAALHVARSAGAGQVALLHCVSAYPVPIGCDNLGAIVELRRAFDVPVGLSDHSTNELAVAIAVSLGAAVYERHLVLDRTGEAVDEAVSATPDELSLLVALAARTRDMMGSGRRTCQPAERANLAASRRALYATRRIVPGETVTDDAVVALRPATGLSARARAALIGVRASRLIEAGAPFLLADLGENDDERSA